MLPRLFGILQTGQGSPADIGEEYLAKMRLRVPQVCHMNASGMRLEPVLEMHELYCASHWGSMCQMWQLSKQHTCKFRCILCTRMLFRQFSAGMSEQRDTKSSLQRAVRGRTVVQGRNVTRIVDKMLRNAFNLGYIQLTLPKACVVHVVRHPMDVALSCFSQPFEGRGLPWAAQLDGKPAMPTCKAHLHQVIHHACGVPYDGRGAVLLLAAL